MTNNEPKPIKVIHKSILPESMWKYDTFYLIQEPDENGIALISTESNPYHAECTFIDATEIDATITISKKTLTELITRYIDQIKGDPYDSSLMADYIVKQINTDD